MNKYHLPESFATERPPFKLPIQYKRLGIIADLHVPYHSIPALTATFDYFSSKGIDSLIINGDLIDFYQLSRFQKDPRKRSVKFELDSVGAFFDALKMWFPQVKVFYKKGNHDIRYDKWMQVKAPEFLDIENFDFANVLKLRERDIELIDDKTYIKAGGLTVVHGHELNMKSVTVNPARTLFLKAKVSSLCAHLHTPSHHAGKRIDGHVTGCWSMGHLGEESPDYAPYNEWCHGFAIVDIDKEEFEVSNYKILKNKVHRT